MFFKDSDQKKLLEKHRTAFLTNNYFQEILPYDCPLKVIKY